MNEHNSYHEPGDPVLAAWQEQLEQTKEKPWLAALLLRQGERILRRFTYFYERLRTLPRTPRRTIQKKWATTLAGAALLLALAGPVVPAAHAATITVHPGAAGVNGSDGGCSLVEAILTANTGTYSSGDCDGGTAGPDTITLAGNTYSYSTAYGTGFSGLPHITSDITIDANSATIQRTGGGYGFRIESGGNLTLNEATLTGSIGDYAAVYNDASTATINNCTITGSAGPAVYNFNGTTTINSSTISGNTGIRAGMGVYNASTGTPAVVTINNSTITNNESTTSAGGGIANGFNANAVLNLNQTIVSGNSSSSGGNDIQNWSGVINSSQNVLGDSSKTNAQAFSGFTPSGTDRTATSDGTNATALAAILNTTLQPFPGDTNPHPATHALVSGSPAVDFIAINGTTCIAGTTVDQRGAARANGASQGGTACDTGAFEYASSQTPTAITIEGLTAYNEGKAAPVAGATGILALLTGGWLARARRRKA